MPARTITIYKGASLSGAGTVFSGFVPTGDFRDGEGTQGLNFQLKALAARVMPSVVNGTVDITLQGSFSGLSADAFDLPAADGPSGAKAAFASVTVPGSEAISLAGPLPPFVRAKVVKTGASVAAEIDLMLQAVGVK